MVFRQPDPRDGKIAANWVINELFGHLKKEDHDITESPVSAAQLGQIIELIGSDTISGNRDPRVVNALI